MRKRVKFLVLLFLLLFCALAWLIVRAKPATETDIRRSACFVKGNSLLYLVSGKDSVVLAEDSVNQEGVWINRHWWWPSCDGRVLTCLRPMRLRNDSIYAKGTSHLAAVVLDSLSNRLKRKQIETKELAYYLRSHGVIDEGYAQIAAYAERQAAEAKTLNRRVTILRDIVHKDSLNAKKANLHLITKFNLRVSWYGDDSLHTVNSNPLIISDNSSSQATSASGSPKTSDSRIARPFIIHTHRSIKPWGVYAVRNVPWGAAKHRKIITVTLTTPTTSAFESSKSVSAKEGTSNSVSTKDAAFERCVILTAGSYDRGIGHDLPQLFAAEGSPVFTSHGRFIGIISRKEVLK